MISENDASAFYLAAKQNIPTPPLTVLKLCATILDLYERVSELEEDLADAADHQCGCLGGTIMEHQR